MKFKKIAQIAEDIHIREGTNIIIEETGSTFKFLYDCQDGSWIGILIYEGGGMWSGEIICSGGRDSGSCFECEFSDEEMGILKDYLDKI